MEILATLVAGGIVLVFLVLVADTVALVLGSCIVGMIGATGCMLRQLRGSIQDDASSRLGVAMWSDIAAILDERR